MAELLEGNKYITKYKRPPIGEISKILILEITVTSIQYKNLDKNYTERVLINNFYLDYDIIEQIV